MGVYRNLDYEKLARALVVRFRNTEIREISIVDDVGKELLGLIEIDDSANVILDFEDVAFMSSAALLKLIAANRIIKGRGGRLKLCGIRPEIKDVFSITHLDRVLDIFPDRTTAIASCGDE